MDDIRYYTNPARGKPPQLPLRKSPVRFAVINKDGLSSNSWRVWVERYGDVYIACRDHMRNQLKVSLHRSGQQQIAFTVESSLEVTEGNRFFNRWAEPQLAPSFRLLFPSWSLGLNEEVREANSEIWSGNEVFIEGADSPNATVVSFILADEQVTQVQGNASTLYVATLTTQPGRSLLVIAYEVPEDPIAKLSAATMADVDSKWGERLHETYGGETLGITVKGIAADGGGYLMALPLRVR
ncbi:MAG: hypothetical protein OXL97_12350 [Chloroflexota bacterium]|nr:hypothetical protein [Chloroflexota bacterium]MDE2883870.1 hypothetical protein [Chloroflexota bacterium]